jgi:hypothetical protein
LRCQRAAADGQNFYQDHLRYELRSLYNTLHRCQRWYIAVCHIRHVSRHT